MSVLIFAVFVLLFLGVGGLFGCLAVKKRRAKEEGEKGITENERVRAMGLRGLVSSNVTSNSDNAEAKKRLLSVQPSGSFGISTPRVRQQTFEYSSLSAEAVAEVLVTIEQMVVDFKNRFKHLESIPPEVLYSTSTNIVSHLLLARRLLFALEKRVELVRNELDSHNPNPKKAYEIATERLVLSCDSVNTLISSQYSEPIRWTSLGPTVSEILGKLDVSITEYRRKKQSGKARYA